MLIFAKLLKTMIDIKILIRGFELSSFPRIFLSLTFCKGYIIMLDVGFFRQEGGVFMRYIMSFVVAIVARLVGDCVSKWINSHNKADK